MKPGRLFRAARNPSTNPYSKDRLLLRHEASVQFNVTTVNKYDIWWQECTTPVLYTSLQCVTCILSYFPFEFSPSIHMDM